MYNMDKYSQQAFDKMISDIVNAPKYKRLWWWICRQTLNLRYIPKRVYRSVTGATHRARHGYSHADTWNLDMYLANLIANSIKHLRDTAHGHPTHMTANEWDSIQTKIILGFNLYVWGADEITLTEDEREQMEEGMRLFIEHFRHLWS